MISRKSDYAIRAISYILMNRNEKISTKKIAEDLNIPYKFLTQIFLELVRKGILVSERGSRGCIRLKKMPHEVSLLDIIEAVEGPFKLHQCIADFNEACFFAGNCLIKEKLLETERETRRLLASTTLDKINIDQTIKEA